MCRVQSTRQYVWGRQENIHNKHPTESFWAHITVMTCMPIATVYQKASRIGGHSQTLLLYMYLKKLLASISAGWVHWFDLVAEQLEIASLYHTHKKCRPILIDMWELKGSYIFKDSAKEIIAQLQSTAVCQRLRVGGKYPCPSSVLQFSLVWLLSLLLGWQR